MAVVDSSAGSYPATWPEEIRSIVARFIRLTLEAFGVDPDLRERATRIANDLVPPTTPASDAAEGKEED